MARKLSEFVKPAEDYVPFEIDLEDGDEPVRITRSQYDFDGEEQDDLIVSNRPKDVFRIFLGEDFDRAWKSLKTLRAEELLKLLDEVREHFRVQHDAKPGSRKG